MTNKILSMLSLVLLGGCDQSVGYTTGGPLAEGIEGWTEIPCLLSETDSYETPIENVTEHSYTYSNRAIYRAHIPTNLFKRCLPSDDCSVIESETLSPICGERWEEMLCEVTEDDFYCVVTETQTPIPFTPISAWVNVTQ